MHIHHRPPSSPTREELRASMLNAAIVLRDLSFLHHPAGCVSLGCRAIMRQHALQWRTPPSQRAAVLEFPRLGPRDDAVTAA